MRKKKENVTDQEWERIARQRANEEGPANPIPFIRELLRGGDEYDIREAEENFRRYLGTVGRIAERLEREKAETV